MGQSRAHSLTRHGAYTRAVFLQVGLGTPLTAAQQQLARDLLAGTAPAPATMRTPTPAPTPRPGLNMTTTPSQGPAGTHGIELATIIPDPARPGPLPIPLAASNSGEQLGHDLPLLSNQGAYLTVAGTLCRDYDDDPGSSYTFNQDGTWKLGFTYPSVAPGTVCVMHLIVFPSSNLGNVLYEGTAQYTVTR